MLIDHERKFCFFRVPKTGSSTFMFMLQMAGGWSDKTIWSANALGFEAEPWGMKVVSGNTKRNPIIDHLTPSDAVAGGYITVEQLREYRCVAMIREPVDRYISAYSHFNRHTPEAQRPDSNLPLHHGLLTRPQMSWFMCGGEVVCDPLWFDDYEKELKSLLFELSGIQFEKIPRLNSSGIKPESFESCFDNDEDRERITAILEHETRFYNFMKGERNGC